LTTAFWAIAAQALARARELGEEPPGLIVVDPKGTDYERITAELGGVRIKFGAGSAHAINVLDVPPPDPRRPETDPIREQTRTVVGLIAVLCSTPTAPLGPDDTALAEEAVLAAYAEAGADPDDPTTWGLPPERTPVLADVVEHLERLAERPGDAEHARRVARRLKAAATGTLRRLFGERTTVSLDAPVVSFDLSALDDAQIRQAAVYLIGGHVWRAARRDPRRRILGLDEVPTLLAHESSARLVGDLYALGRSFGLLVCSMGQLLADYEHNQDGVRALDNSATVLLIRQAGGAAVQAAARRYGLSAEECLWLTDHAQRGDGILITPRGRVAIHVQPSPLALSWLPERAAERATAARPAPIAA
jgi:hypothetical protein